MKASAGQLAVADEHRRDVARSGEIAPPIDLAAALGGFLGDLAKAGFDDVSVRVATEITPTGTKSTFDYRAYRYRRS